MEEKEQPIQQALKGIKELMTSPVKASDPSEDVLELTEDDLYVELDEDYQDEFNQEKTDSVNENLTQMDHSSNRKDPSLKNSSQQEDLISGEDAAKSAATIRELIKKMEKPIADAAKLNKNITLEEITAEAIKPFLKDWLDQHLPEIVQRIVEDEVRKLIPNKDIK